MRIAFYFNGTHLQSFCHENFIRGDIGISGTDSSFFRVIDAFVKNKHEVHLFSMGLDDYPGVHFHKIEKQENAFSLGSMVIFDACIFIIRNISGSLKEFIQKVTTHQSNLMAWAQNPVSPAELEVLCISGAVKRIIYVEAYHLHHIRHTKAFDKSIFIPNGIPLEEYRVKSAANSKHEAVVTFIGSLTPAKGFHIMAAAWQRVLETVPHAQLFIAGDARLYDKTHKSNSAYFHEGYGQLIATFLGKTKEEQEQNHVHFLGLLTRNQVIEQMASSSLVCINPNTKDALECCSVTSLEAQACGTPVVAGGAGGNLCTILHKKTGLLTNGSEEDLAIKISRLLKNGKLNNRLREAGPGFINSKYHIDKVYKRWELEIKAIANNIPVSRQPLPVRLLSAKLLAKEMLRYKRKLMG